MVRCVCNHAAYFHIHFPYGLLAVPLLRLNFESAPLFLLPPTPLSRQRSGRRKEIQMSAILTYEYLVKKNRAEKDAKDEVLHKVMFIKFAVAAIVIAICNGVAIGQMGDRKHLGAKNNTARMQYAQEFLTCRSRMGGSVLEPLVSRLNNIDEHAMILSVPRTARSITMSEIAGRIGPVNYHRYMRTTTTTSTRCVGTIQGYSATGGGRNRRYICPSHIDKVKNRQLCLRCAQWI